MQSNSGVLPRPFEPDVLPGRYRRAARALWAWHDAAGSTADPDTDLRRIDLGEAPVHAPDTWRAAVTVCREHDLDSGLLERRLRAERRIRRGPGPGNGPDLHSLISDRVGGHARLLAALAGMTGSWQLDLADTLSRGFFLTETVIRTSARSAHGHPFFAREDLDRFDVPPDALAGDRPAPGLRRLVWKQAVRARDALARGRLLIEEMPFILAYRSRVYWFGALELLVRAEKSDWDVGASPPAVDCRLRARARMMALFGRTVFRTR